MIRERHKNSKPPFFAELIVKQLSWFGDQDAILDNLKEEYQDRVTKQGKFLARWWYRLHVLRSILPFMGFELKWRVVMLRNYLKITFRHLFKNKSYSFINIFGLATGMAASILIALYVIDELSYDRHNEKAERIYRVGSKRGPGGKYMSPKSEPPLAAALKEDFPEIESVARLYLWPVNKIVSYKDKKFRERRIIFADSSVFDIFTIPFIQGDPKTALTQPRTIVITQMMAEKYFGDEDPLGKLLLFDDGKNAFQVTGVVEDLPSQSHFHFDFIGSLSTLPDSRSRSWFRRPISTYIVLHEDMPPSQLEAKLPDFYKRHIEPELPQFTDKSFDEIFSQPENYYAYWLEPLLDIHLNPDLDASFGVEEKGNILYVTILSIVSIFILLIACINFMNLSTARFSLRLKEIGIRKVLGTNRFELIRLFLIESLLVSFISLFIALLFIQLLLPTYNQIIGRVIELNTLKNFTILPAFVGLAIFIGIGAGCYPAFFLSSFSPEQAIRNATTQKIYGFVPLRKALVVFQFVMTMGIFLFSVVIYQQLAFINGKDLGFDKNHIMVIHGADGLESQGTAFKQELIHNPSIKAVSYTNSMPGRFFDGWGYRLEGAPIEESLQLRTMIADDDFAKLLDLEIVEGRYFSNVFTSNTREAIINEAAVRELGLKESVGKRLIRNGFITIVGVTKDINFSSLHSEVGPMAIYRLRNTVAEFVSVKIDPSDIQDTIAFIEEKWDQHSNSQPFEYTFFNEDLNLLYKSDLRTGKIFSGFSILAIIVASLGLFGLVSFSCDRRIKEVGIRKVLGASISNVTILLSKETFLLVSMASIIASPISYFTMKSWLQNFAYRVDISLWIFVLALFAIALISMTTVSIKTIRTAKSNPIDSLKYE